MWRGFSEVVATSVSRNTMMIHYFLAKSYRHFFTVRPGPALYRNAFKRRGYLHPFFPPIFPFKAHFHFPIFHEGHREKARYGPANDIDECRVLAAHAVIAAGDDVTISSRYQRLATRRRLGRRPTPARRGRQPAVGATTPA